MMRSRTPISVPSMARRSSEALHLQARHMTSCVLINEGNGRWRARELPMEAQRSPIMALPWRIGTATVIRPGHRRQPLGC